MCFIEYSRRDILHSTHFGKPALFLISYHFVQILFFLGCTKQVFLLQSCQTMGFLSEFSSFNIEVNIFHLVLKVQWSLLSMISGVSLNLDLVNLLNLYDGLIEFGLTRLISHSVFARPFLLITFYYRCVEKFIYSFFLKLIYVYFIFLFIPLSIWPQIVLISNQVFVEKFRLT